MTRFSLIDALLFGPRRMAARPLHAAAFAVVTGLALLAYYLWFGSETGQGYVRGYGEAVMRSAEGDVTALGDIFGFMGLLMTAGVLAGVILSAGAGRVLLREETPWWAPVRLGLDELRYFLIGVLLVLIYFGLTLAFSILMAMVSMVVIGALMASGSNFGAASMASAIVGLLMLFPLLYFIGRFAVAFPIATIDRRMNFAGWKATKGAGWSLLGANLVVYLAWMVLFYVINPEALVMAIQSTRATPDMLSADYFTQQFNAAIPSGPRAALSAFLVGVGYLVLFGPIAYAGDRYARSRSDATSGSETDPAG